MDFTIENLFFLGSVPIIMAVVQIFKQWASDTRLYPIVAVVTGMLVNLIIGRATNQGMILSVFAGLIAGFTAGGV